MKIEHKKDSYKEEFVNSCCNTMTTLIEEGIIGYDRDDKNIKLFFEYMSVVVKYCPYCKTKITHKEVKRFSNE